MKVYLVKTIKNPNYRGKTLGVSFSKGMAYLSPQTIDPKLGHSIEEVARLMQRDFGYEVEPGGREK